MKIEDAVRAIAGGLLRQRIRQFLEDHPDEVFRARELADRLDMSYASVAEALRKIPGIYRLQLSGRCVYYAATKETIQALRAKLREYGVYGERK